MTAPPPSRPKLPHNPAFRAFIIAALLASIPISGIILLGLRRSMTPALGMLVLWHVAGGLLASLGIVFAFKNFVGKRPRSASNNIIIAAGAVTLVSGAAMVVAAGSGLSILRLPGAYESHIFAGLVLAAVLLVKYFFPLVRGQNTSRLSAASLILVSAACMAAAGYQPDRYFRVLTATRAQQAGNALFPAGSLLHSPDSWARAQSPESCGASGCHTDSHRGWEASAHARSSRSPAYQRALQQTVRKQGADTARWCAGCHDPASLRPGVRSAGIDCLSCHTAHEIPLRTGGGLAAYSPPEEYPFARETSGWRKRAHDFLIRIRPLPHSASLSAPARNGALTCLPCHRLGVTAAQNESGFVLYDDTWGQWHRSPNSGKSLHTFRPSARVDDCTNCHAPHARSPYVPESRLQALQESLSIQLFALRRPGERTAERVEAPLAKRHATIGPGERAAVDVLVRNKGIGHGFPSGAPDLKTAWIEIVLKDGQDRPLARSGSPVANQELDPAAHRYGLIALDTKGVPVPYGLKAATAAHLFEPPEGAGQVRQSGYRSLPAGESDVARYSFIAPAAPGVIRITARLWYSPSLETGLASSRPILLGTHSTSLRVGGPGISTARLFPPAGQARDDPRDGEDLFAYGIALFNQKDPQRARRAFQQSRALKPGDPEHLIAIGRSFLEEGDLLSARANFEKAIRMPGGRARGAAWLGRTLRIMGRYGEALSTLQPLTESHPEDSLTWFDVGLSQFRLGRLSEAVESLQKVVELTPDDAGAHLNLMLCYRRMRKLTDARREEAIYQNLRNEGRPPALVQQYSQRHPADALEASVRHEHRLSLKP